MTAYIPLRSVSPTAGMPMATARATSRSGMVSAVPKEYAERLCNDAYIDQE